MVAHTRTPQLMTAAPLTNSSWQKSFRDTSSSAESQGPSNFDYAALAPDLAGNLRASAEQIRTRIGRHTAEILDTGRDLLTAKQSLKHGQFLVWIERECRIPINTAQLYMRAKAL
jgi:hypothetical protein